MMRIFATATLLAGLSVGATQASTVIYSEDFTGQNGLGAIGTNTADTTGASWSVDLGDANLINSGDIFGVVNEAFTVQDTNAGCSDTVCTGTRGDDLSGVDIPTWFSPVIDLTGFTNIMLSFTASVIGSIETDGGVGVQDTFFYNVTSDMMNIEALELISLVGSGPDTISTTDPSIQNTLQISFAATTYAGSETIIFDDILVTGDALTPVPLPASGLLLLGGLAGLYARKKRG